MLTGFSDRFSGTSTVIFGRTRQGLPLEEHVWGNQDKSILFLSGLSPKDAPLSQALLRWERDLIQGEMYGGILGDFDLKSLKERCRIRLIPYLDPEIKNSNRIGIGNTEEKLRNQRYYKGLIPVEETNERGVNLNRNFNSNWIKLRKMSPERTDCGPFPESEGEVYAFSRRIREALPTGAVVLRSGQNCLFYPEQTTPKELKEAVFLGQYAALPLRRAEESDGTAFQWLHDRGIKTLEIRIEDPSRSYEKLKNLLTMCAALV